MPKPFNRHTDPQIADELEGVARNLAAGGATPTIVGLLEEAAHRLRRGGGVTITDATAGRDINAIAGGGPSFSERLRRERP